MMTRRKFLTALAAAPALAAFYAWGVESTWEEYVRRAMPIAALPKGLEGKTLVQLSDIHVGNQVDAEYLKGVFAKVTALQPDLVAYTGDFVSHRGPATLAQLSEAAASFPRGKLGTVAVLGNHDYGRNWREFEVAEAVAGILSGQGCTVLRNAAVEVAGLKIGGVEDWWSGRLDLAGCLGAGRRPSLVLCHNPDACDAPGWEGFEGWILSGHTHGGQCRPPFLPPPILPVRNRRYTAGEFDLGSGRRLYINRGLGHLLKVRFNVRPEVTIFELTGRSAGVAS